MQINSSLLAIPQRALSGSRQLIALLVLSILGLLNPAIEAEAQTFTGSLSGAWWNAARDGEGIMISFETAGGQTYAVVAFFTYSVSGGATWMVGGAPYQAGATTISVPVTTGSGARFGSAFRTTDVQRLPAGTITLEFQSCTSMRMRYSGTETLTIDLTRTVGPLTGVTCSFTSAPASPKDLAVRTLAAGAGQTGQPTTGRTLPSITAPLAQLGKLLFFSKTLSGNLDVACASCHHPALGGADGLALSVGTGAANPDLIGPGRRLTSGVASVPRNSNTFFNVGLLDLGLFWDSRVESLGKLARQNGVGSGIRTPDSNFGVADPNAGLNLPAAQARFPVVSVEEMRGTAMPGLSDNLFRNHLAARLGNHTTGAGHLAPGNWLQHFRIAFQRPAGTAEELITFDNIAAAIAEYQRSAVFVDTPWSRFVRGDNSAISEEAKDGALIFFRTTAQGGAHCSRCHVGDLFTNERHHALGFPQVGPGKNDGGNAGDDFGRGRQSGSDTDRYRFRTPSLLNVELTAPYGHAGTYNTLDSVIAHYVVPDATVNDFLARRVWCTLPPFSTAGGCGTDAQVVTRNTQAALARMKSDRTTDPSQSMPVVDPTQVTPEASNALVAFLRTLTDPCLKDRSCFGRWVPTAQEAPDAHQLNAVDQAGRAL